MNPNNASQSRLVVLSAPSGGGKTTITKILAERNPNYKISISATTRPRRSFEKDGVDYDFLSEEQFFEKVRNGEFLEHEEVHGNRYGTLKARIESLLDDGYTVLFDIDVYGALNIKKQYPDAVLIFIRPPSMDELKDRLKKRKTDTSAEIEKRLSRLPEEYAKSVFFDYDVVNNDLEQTVEKITHIIENAQKQVSHVSNKPVQG